MTRMSDFVTPSAFAIDFAPIHNPRSEYNVKQEDTSAKNPTATRYHPLWASRHRFRPTLHFSGYGTTQTANQTVPPFNFAPENS
jgi:hypothetical protein